MPLLILSAEDATERARQARSRWPLTSESQARRLTPLAQPDFSPSFAINKMDPIFTIGSCFARNIEKQLLHEGYNVAISRFQTPTQLHSRADPDTLLHRYTPHSIANELKWALSADEPFPEPSYVDLGAAGWYDLQLHPLASPGPLPLVKARRSSITDYIAQAGTAKVFIMTLGLAEAWFDRETGCYLNAVPIDKARKLHPGRFEFHLLGYDEVLAGLEQIHSLLASHGEPDLKMLVTVSPVALSTTFTGGDAMSANAYMKSVLRAAAEAFVRGHEDVDYFPSYESVVLSDRRYAWRADQAHVSDEMVRLNVVRMIEAYAEDPPVGGGRQVAEAIVKAHEARQAAAAGAVEDAIGAYRAAIAAAPDEGLILLEFGRFLFEQKQHAEAARLVEASIERGTGPYGGYLYLAQIQYAAGRYGLARDAALKAQELQPDRPGVIGMLERIAQKLDPETAALKAPATVAVAPVLDRLKRVFRAGLAGLRASRSPGSHA